MRIASKRTHIAWPLLSLLALVLSGHGCPDASAQMVGPPSPPSDFNAQGAPGAGSSPTVVDLLMARESGASMPDSPALVAEKGAEIESRSLGPAPVESRTEPAGGSVGSQTAVTDGWLGRTIFATAIVVGLALLARSAVRRISSRGGGIASQMGAGGRAPSGLLMVLGRYPIARGQTLVLLKIDRRVLLLCQGPAGFQTLTEITDPEEVASLLVKSRDEEGESLASRFTSMLRRAERDPSICGDVIEELPNSNAPTVLDDDSWAIRDRLGEANQEASTDPLSVLRHRLRSIHEGAV